MKTKRLDCYVYQHIRLDTNQIFYIGVGTGRNYWRSKEKERRNDHWKRIVSKTEYRIEIIYDNLSLKDALEKEIELISFYGRQGIGTGILVNQTNGGEGTTGIIIQDSTRSKLSSLWKNRKRTEEDKASKSAGGIFGWVERKERNEFKRTNKKIICLNNGKTYFSGREAALELNLSVGMISMVCTGKREKTKGYKFIFA